MISHDFKCIFIHIPKAAGQSVEHFFLKKVGLDWNSRSPLLLRKNDEPDAGPGTLAHMRAADYVKYHYISQELFEQYFKFSFVRNPWSRAVSTYKFLGYNVFMSFETFVFKHIPKLMKNKGWFIMPQYDMLYENGIKQVDFIGKFEQINIDFQKVCTHLGFTDTNLPHINKSRKQHLKGFKSILKQPGLVLNLGLKKIKSENYQDYYTEKTKLKIQEMYKKDVEQFEYEF